MPSRSARPARALRMVWFAATPPATTNGRPDPRASRMPGSPAGSIHEAARDRLLESRREIGSVPFVHRAIHLKPPPDGCLETGEGEIAPGFPDHGAWQLKRRGLVLPSQWGHRETKAGFAHRTPRDRVVHRRPQAAVGVHTVDGEELCPPKPKRDMGNRPHR